MAGYSGTPLWKKLGYKDGLVACASGTPKDYIASLDLPPTVSVKWASRAGHDTAIVHLFATRTRVLETRLQSLRNAIPPSGAIWVSWPKKSSGVPSDITEDVIRAVALPLGLVDVKVCAIDDVWSGLKLMIRKELRATIQEGRRPRLTR